MFCERHYALACAAVCVVFDALRSTWTAPTRLVRKWDNNALVALMSTVLGREPTRKIASGHERT